MVAGYHCYHLWPVRLPGGSLQNAFAMYITFPNHKYVMHQPPERHMVSRTLPPHSHRAELSMEDHSQAARLHSPRHDVPPISVSSFPCPAPSPPPPGPVAVWSSILVSITVSSFFTSLAPLTTAPSMLVVAAPFVCASPCSRSCPCSSLDSDCANCPCAGSVLCDGCCPTPCACAWACVSTSACCLGTSC
jgi:hypothetical protein